MSIFVDESPVKQNERVLLQCIMYGIHDNTGSPARPACGIQIFKSKFNSEPSKTRVRVKEGSECFTGPPEKP
jgi:hypothetical protein